MKVARVVYRGSSVLCKFGLFCFIWSLFVFGSYRLTGIPLRKRSAIYFTRFAVTFCPTGLLFALIYCGVFIGVCIYLYRKLRQQRGASKLTAAELKEKREVAQQQTEDFIIA